MGQDCQLIQQLSQLVISVQ